jgi:dihydropyrimidinase
VLDQGITTFKHFMAYKGALMVNDDELFASFRGWGELGGIALVHAENGDVVAELQRKLLAEGNTRPEAHAYSRPPQVEGEATNRAIMIADMAGVPLYVVHVSSEDAHEAIRRARAQGKRVWGEPLIQHLTLDDSEYRHPTGTTPRAGSCRRPSGQAPSGLAVGGLQSGSLSVVRHRPLRLHHRAEAVRPGDFTKIPNGTGGLEDRMPMLWTHGSSPAASRPTSSSPSRAPTSPRSWAATPQGRRDGRGRRRPGGLGPPQGEDDHRERPAERHRLQRLRRPRREGPPPLHSLPRHVAITTARSAPARATASS